MKRTTLIATIFILGIVIVASVYGVPTLLYSATSPSSTPPPNTVSPTPTPMPSPSTATPTPSPSSTNSTRHSLHLPSELTGPTTITVVDGAGRNVTLTVPVQRIVSINSGLTEMLCALGAQDKLVGRDRGSDKPSSVLSVPVVGDNSYLPNVEVILELKPDVIFADSMLPYNDVAMNQLEAAGFPIFISDPTDPTPTKRSNTTVVDFSCNLISKLASIVGNQAKANEYITYVQYYNNLVKTRIATLTQDQRPKVMLEWYQPYYTFVTAGLDHAGGINIAENQTVYAPLLSPEFVVEQNPAVIIRMSSSSNHNVADFIAERNEILNRAALANVDAIKNGRVYICDWDIRGGISSVVGYLSWAKWCQPTLFADINPAAIHAELYQRFFGTTIEGTFVYP